MTAVQFTTVNAEVLGEVQTPLVRFTSISAEVLAYVPTPKLRFTQIFAEALTSYPVPKTRFTHVFMNVLATRTPDFRFTQVVYADVFPYDISYNSVGSVRFATDVTIVDSGNDQRISRWDQPLHEYDVAYGVRTMEQLQSLIGFFKAMRGRKSGFCYKDWLDYSSSTAVAYEARSAPPITAFDQQLGVGDGVTYIFQLTKNYATTYQNIVRPITRPIPGSVLMAIEGATTTNFTEDDTTGLISFTSPCAVNISGHCSKTASDGSSGGTCVFTAAAGTFFPFIAFYNYYIMTSGWSTPLNNIPQTKVGIILNVSGDGSQLTIANPTGYGIASESNVSGTSFAVNPAPLPGTVVTAGFYFFVPVRFDTDTLSMTLKDYGVGDATSVKLIEIRPTDPN